MNQTVQELESRRHELFISLGNSDIILESDWQRDKFTITSTVLSLASYAEAKNKLV